LAAAEAERAATRAWWMRLRLPALGFATAVVATVAVGLMRGSGDRPLAPRPGDGERRVVAQAPTKDKPPLVASRERGGPQATATGRITRRFAASIPARGRNSARSTVAGSPVNIEPQTVAGMIAGCAVRDGSRFARISSRRVISPTPSSR